LPAPWIVNDSTCNVNDMDPRRADDEVGPLLRRLAEAAIAYLDQLDDRDAVTPSAERALGQLSLRLPEDGHGAASTLVHLLDFVEAAPRSSGPHWFGFVTGGATPAALAADWLASALDQNAALWIHSPLASHLEAVSLDWLKELFRLPRNWAGVLTDGATMANFVGLACARHWWAQHHGVDVDRDGFTDLPPIPVFSSGYLHSSARKALGMLGIGRQRVELVAQDATGALDLAALERKLAGLKGAPAIIIANAGEVNSGAFDPLSAMATAAGRHGAWLHVDAAFGLFARLAPTTADLIVGIERADSVASDAHKWLNVPFDSGFALVRDGQTLRRSFSVLAPYLDQPGPRKPSFQTHSPQGSRRARSFAVWATLAAYGRDGYQAMVERHLSLAQRLASQVDAAPDLERLAPVPLNIVCFRFRPPDTPESDLDRLNLQLEHELQLDGRIFVGTTRYAGRVAFRPALLNWRMSEDDVDLLVSVVREVGHRVFTKSRRL
jgi:glutamate/tyrosine decarboxylase-like PLP-dependent enzyme